MYFDKKQISRNIRSLNCATTRCSRGELRLAQITSDQKKVIAEVFTSSVLGVLFDVVLSYCESARTLQTYQINVYASLRSYVCFDVGPYSHNAVAHSSHPFVQNFEFQCIKQ